MAAPTESHAEKVVAAAGGGANADEPNTGGAPLMPHVAAGVAGRVAAETFKSPFDLLKVRRQYDLKLQSRSLPLALITVLRSEGIKAWRGLPPRLIWASPLAGATFTYYQVLKRETGGSDANEGQSSRLTAKTVVGGPLVLALSVAMRTPFDIVEQQLQLANAQQPGAAPQAGEELKKLRPTIRSISEKIQATWKAEGVRGVWRGYPAAVCGIATYIAGYFVIYEGARRAFEQRSMLNGYTTTIHLLAGGLGGGLTAVLATPFDTIKVRMQTKIYVTAADPFPSLLRVCKATLQEGGWQGLWRGATYRFASNAPAGAIMFAVYESGYRWFERKLY